MAERRHRIHGIELGPTEQALKLDLIRRIQEREDLLNTSILFRLWYRIYTHCVNKPKYPPHDTWGALEAATGYGTVIQSIELAPTIKEGSP